MKKTPYLIATGLVLVLSMFLFSSPKEKHVEVKIGSKTISAEVADSFLKRAKGLMFRESLPGNSGMLFVFGKGDRHAIWMMNMSFPIDIVWLDSEKRVVHIAENAQPCGLRCDVYKPDSPALYVLEVNAGFARENGLKIGGKASFDIS